MEIFYDFLHLILHGSNWDCGKIEKIDNITYTVYSCKHKNCSAQRLFKENNI